jgi:hypothetical protein
MSTNYGVQISAARIAGMNRELGFNVGDRYSIALLVFFVTYFIFEIPSNVVLRKVGAANWLSFLCFAWGLAVFGAGFAKKWEVSDVSKFETCSLGTNRACRISWFVAYCWVCSRLVSSQAGTCRDEGVMGVMTNSA